MPDLTGIYPNGTGHGNTTLLLNRKLCTVETCDLSLASFLYLPTLPGNVAFAGLFAVLMAGQIFLGVKHKSWGYMVAMVMGLFCEIIGYVARILLNNSPFERNYFLIYLITLTIGPAFLSAAIYLCLSRIVILYGSHLARFGPRTYTIFFCGCDIISLVLQGSGGGISATAKTASLVDVGKNIMLAGLGFQVFSLTLFLICGTDVAIQMWKRSTLWNRKHLNVIKSRRFNWFLVGLAVATITIHARSTYRCVELSGGFRGELFVSDEPLFIVMEGVMISIACICLTCLHPGICFQGVWNQVVFPLRGGKSSPVWQELSDLERRDAEALSRITSIYVFLFVVLLDKRMITSTIERG